MVTQIPNAQPVPIYPLTLQIPSAQQILNVGGVDLISLMIGLMIFGVMAKVAAQLGR